MHLAVFMGDPSSWHIGLSWGNHHVRSISGTCSCKNLILLGWANIRFNDFNCPHQYRSLITFNT